MPDHIHLLLTPEVIALERAIGLIKGTRSRSIGLSPFAAMPLVGPIKMTKDLTAIVRRRA
jgi:hypothetical protein